MPEKLQESEKLSQPMFTPSTKAEQGEHDENIHPDQCIPPKN
jgi:phosphoribosylaminoimidazole-succinocarboxamide synthase